MQKHKNVKAKVQFLKRKRQEKNFPIIVRGTVIEVELESAVALGTPEIASE